MCYNGHMKVDGRKLSHEKLEEIRFQAVRAVQDGQSPTEVARSLGLYVNRVFIWLAAYRTGVGTRCARRRLRVARSV